MHSVDRHERILAGLRADGRVEVGALAAALAVTTETIRRDLAGLERRGLLRRVHGGAVAVGRLAVEPTRRERAAALVAEKRRIAAAAVEELGDARVLILDAGTTTAELVDVLPAGRGLTVVTNDVAIALRAAARADLTVLHTGGELRAATQAAVGPWAADHLASIGADLAFMATSGISAERGLTVSTLEDAASKQAMLAAAPRAVLLADRSKLGHDFFAAYAGLGDVDLLVTDAPAGDERLAALRDAGLPGARTV